MNLDYPEHFPRPAGQSGLITVRVIAGVAGLCAGAVWPLCTFMVLSSLYSTNPASDPHGYAVVFGTLMGVPSGLVCAVLLPLTFARPQWRRGYRIVIPSFLALLGLQFLAMYLS